LFATRIAALFREILSTSIEMFCGRLLLAMIICSPPLGYSRLVLARGYWPIKF